VGTLVDWNNVGDLEVGRMVGFLETGDFDGGLVGFAVGDLVGFAVGE